MSKIKQALFFIFFALGLVFVPLFSAWWLFLPLAVFSAFFLSRSIEALIAGFILDSIYYGSLHAFPRLTLFVLIILVFRLVFRDKLRL